jgi:hypothetical protein
VSAAIPSVADGSGAEELKMEFGEVEVAVGVVNAGNSAVWDGEGVDAGKIRGLAFVETEELGKF